MDNTFVSEVSDIWTIAVDVGYSAVKVYAPNKIFTFPTFARESEFRELKIFTPDITTMRYRSSDGIVYDVGGRAIEIADINEVYDNDSMLYRRNWYNNEAFRICLESALAIAIMSNSIRAYNGEPIRVISGLPCQFMEDSNILRSLIVGEHVFDLMPPAET